MPLTLFPALNNTLKHKFHQKIRQFNLIFKHALPFFLPLRLNVRRRQKGNSFMHGRLRKDLDLRSRKKNSPLPARAVINPHIQLITTQRLTSFFFSLVPGIPPDLSAVPDADPVI